MHPEHQLAMRNEAALEVAGVKRESLDEKPRGKKGRGDATRGTAHDAASQVTG